MILKSDKIIQIYDFITFHQIVTWSSKKLQNFNTTLGEDINFIDQNTFDYRDYTKEFQSPLFPKKRVSPIDIFDLTPHTVVTIRLRSNHFLYNTTLSEKNIGQEVLVDTIRKRLVYLFFNFKTENIRIRPKISHDNFGIIQLLEDNLDNNLIRETILSFMSLHQPPKNINDLLIKNAQNAIWYESDRLAIKYNGGKEIWLEPTESVIDTIFIIQHKVNTDDVWKIWNKIRGLHDKNRKDDNIIPEKLRKKKEDTSNPKKETDSYSIVASMKKNYNRFLKKVQNIEIKMKIPYDQRFSNFLTQYVIIRINEQSISYTAPDSIKWYFDLPEDLSQLIKKEK